MWSFHRVLIAKYKNRNNNNKPKKRKPNKHEMLLPNFKFHIQKRSEERCLKINKKIVSIDRRQLCLCVCVYLIFGLFDFVVSLYGEQASIQWQFKWRMCKTCHPLDTQNIAQLNEWMNVNDAQQHNYNLNAHFSVVCCT